MDRPAPSPDLGSFSSSWPPKPCGQARFQPSFYFNHPAASVNFALPNKTSFFAHLPSFSFFFVLPLFFWVGFPVIFHVPPKSSLRKVQSLTLTPHFLAIFFSKSSPGQGVFPFFFPDLLVSTSLQLALSFFFCSSKMMRLRTLLPALFSPLSPTHLTSNKDSLPAVSSPLPPTHMSIVVFPPSGTSRFLPSPPAKINFSASHYCISHLFPLHPAVLSPCVFQGTFFSGIRSPFNPPPSDRIDLPFKPFPYCFLSFPCTILADTLLRTLPKILV